MINLPVAASIAGYPVFAVVTPIDCNVTTVRQVDAPANFGSLAVKRIESGMVRSVASRWICKIHLRCFYLFACHPATIGLIVITFPHGGAAVVGASKEPGKAVRQRR